MQIVSQEENDNLQFLQKKKKKKNQFFICGFAQRIAKVKVTPSIARLFVLLYKQKHLGGRVVSAPNFGP